uniref:Uncharacterized protein n=1 Tax=mine drainage metagenome TaxID=410659 RepID=E6PVN5_9ZZZZ
MACVARRTLRQSVAQNCHRFQFAGFFLSGESSQVIDFAKISGRGERIRTSGLYVPNVALYQAKLHPDGKTQWIAANKTHALRSKE